MMDRHLETMIQHKEALLLGYSLEGSLTAGRPHTHLNGAKTGFELMSAQFTEQTPGLHLKMPLTLPALHPHP